MTTKLLDTNVCVAALRRRADVVERMVAEFAEGDLRVSTITVFELAYGAARSGRPAEEFAKVSRFFQNGPCVELFGAPEAEAAGQIRADLAARGAMIGAYDLLIAGHALARGWIVVTANGREFSRVDGLAIEDWSEASR